VGFNYYELLKGDFKMAKSKREVKGTVKFEIYLYRAKTKMGKPRSRARGFVFRQWGVVNYLNEQQKVIGQKRFNSYGQMLDFINDKMRKTTMADLKSVKRWK
jgi:hypothetical protein